MSTKNQEGLGGASHEEDDRATHQEEVSAPTREQAESLGGIADAGARVEVAEIEVAKATTPLEIYDLGKEEAFFPENQPGGRY